MRTKRNIATFTTTFILAMMCTDALATGGRHNTCNQMKEALRSIAKKQEQLPIEFTDSQGNKLGTYGELQNQYDELSAKYVILKGLLDLKMEYDSFKARAFDKDFGTVDAQTLNDIQNVAKAKKTAKKLALLYDQFNKESFMYNTQAGPVGQMEMTQLMKPLNELGQECQKEVNVFNSPIACSVIQQDTNKNIFQNFGEQFTGNDQKNMINGFNQAKMALLSNHTPVEQNQIREQILQSYKNIAREVFTAENYAQDYRILDDAEDMMLKNIYRLINVKPDNEAAHTDYLKFREEFAKTDIESFKNDYANCFSNSMFDQSSDPLKACAQEKASIAQSAKASLNNVKSFLLEKELTVRANPEQIEKNEMAILNKRQNILAKVKSLKDFSEIVERNPKLYNFAPKNFMAQYCPSTTEDIAACMKEINGTDLKAAVELANKEFTEIQNARANALKLFDNPDYHQLETMKQYMIADLKNGRCNKEQENKMVLVNASDCGRNLDNSRDLSSFVKVGEDFIRAIDNRYPGVYESELASLEALSTITDMCSKKYNSSIPNDDAELNEEEGQTSSTTNSNMSAEDIHISRYCDTYAKRYQRVRQEEHNRKKTEQKLEDVKKNHYVYDESTNRMIKTPKRSIAATMFVSGMKSSLGLLPTYFQTRANSNIANMQANSLIAQKQYIHNMQGAHQWYGYGVSQYFLDNPSQTNFYFNNPIFFQQSSMALQSISGGSTTTSSTSSFSW